MTAPIPGRRLSDRLLDEGVLVAQTYAGQDRLDPARPTLGSLVAEALALAERRGELRVIDGRDVALAALSDLVAHVDSLFHVVSPDEYPAVRDLAASADRARRHLRPSEEASCVPE